MWKSPFGLSLHCPIASHRFEFLSAGYFEDRSFESQDYSIISYWS